MGGSGAGVSVAWDQLYPTFTNCLFLSNMAIWHSLAGYGNDNYGGAINFEEFMTTMHPTITNCVFAYNMAADGGGAIGGTSSDTTIKNSIFWDNTLVDGSLAHFDGGISLTVLYSCIQDEDPDDGSIPFGGATNHNIDDYPNFVREPNDGGDGWGVSGNNDFGWGKGDNDDFGNLRLQYVSPCIDAADNSAVPADTHDLDGDEDTSERTPLDLEGYPRFVDDPDVVDTGQADPPDYPDVVDMGAYEGADTDGDGIPDEADNCPDIYNPGQSDEDEDQIGDICDNCPNSYDPNQVDTDIDGIGDVCDNCVNTYNQDQYDMDADGIGDECDCLPDLTNNDVVNSEDFGIFALHWLETSCVTPDFCSACDFDKSTAVGIEDLATFIGLWLGCGIP